MTIKEISTIRHFVGAVEGIALTLPNGASDFLLDIATNVDTILDRETDRICKESDLQ